MAAEPEAKRHKAGTEEPAAAPATPLTHAASRSQSPSSSGQESSSSDAPRSGQRRRPIHVISAFSLEALEAELEELRADPPAYVSQVGYLLRPTLVCKQDGNCVPVAPDAAGPWDLTLFVSGKEGDPAYGHPFRVGVRFETDLWPRLAIVRFQGVFHHALTDDSGGMILPFYRALPRNERGACTLRLLLGAVHLFLVDPLKACDLGEEMSTSPRIKAMIGAHGRMNAERFEVIQKYSQRVLHRELFAKPAVWRDEWLEPTFCEARRLNTPAGWRAILQEHLPGEIFSFKMLTQAFCDKLVEEIFHFYESDLPIRRPNSMNNYGIILNEIGMEPLIDELQRTLQPLGELLFPGPGNAWDGQHCFIVRYREGEDLGLDMHTDDSDVTVNICLGLDFDGAGLQFCGLMGAPNHRKHTYTYRHVKGTCLIHLGRKRHGADDITSGERLNLILWNHSNTYRQSDEYERPPYEKEVGPPDTVCVSYTHDRDFGNFKKYPPGKEDFKGKGWCPRRTFEYPGFKPDCEKEQPERS